MLKKELEKRLCEVIRERDSSDEECNGFEITIEKLEKEAQEQSNECRAYINQCNVLRNKYESKRNDLEEAQEENALLESENGNLRAILESISLSATAICKKQKEQP